MMIRNLLIAATAMSAIASGAFAQDSDSATADVNVKFIAPISIANSTSALDFGTLIRSGTGAASIEVTSAGVRGTTTGVTAVAGSAVSAASFAIAGGASETIDIDAAVTGLDAGVTVEPDFGAGPFALDADGELVLPVGGVLTVADGTATLTGAQQGVLTVTVTYP